MLDSNIEELRSLNVYSEASELDGEEGGEMEGGRYDSKGDLIH